MTIENEIPTIVVGKEREGYRAAIPALGKEAVFGPSAELRHVVIEAGQAVLSHLRAVLPGPTYPIPPLVVVPRTHLRADDLLALIEARGVSSELNLSGCYLPLIDLSRAALEAELAKRRRDEETDEPPWRSLLNEGMCLGDAILHDTYLSNAILEGADLTKSDLSKANLAGANLDNGLLWHADFGDAFVRDTSFRGADFLGTHLRGVDLYDAHLEGALWRGALLDRTRIRRERLGKATGEELEAKGQRIATSLTPLRTFHDAREAYLLLKTNFDSIGRYDDASWAYVKEHQMEKAMYFPTTAGHRWIRQELRQGARRWRKKNPGRLRRFLRASILARLQWAWLHLCLLTGHCPADMRRRVREDNIDRPRWLVKWFYEATSGYAQRPILPLLWAALLSIVAFPLLYWATGALPGHARAFTSATPSNIDWAGWGDSIIFSMTSFATLAFNRLQPDGALANILAASEAATGVLLFALFVFTLANRMRRS